MNDNSSCRSAARITSFTLRDKCVKSGLSDFGHLGHGPRSPQSRHSISPPIRSRLIASSSAISSGYSATPVEQRNPAFRFGLFVNHPHHVRMAPALLDSSERKGMSKPASAVTHQIRSRVIQFICALRGLRCRNGHSGCRFGGSENGYSSSSAFPDIGSRSRR